MPVKAKFKCVSVTQFENQKKVDMTAVYSQQPGENADFTRYTPAGNLSISIDNDAPAASAFTPGKEYYLTFEAATA